MSATHTRLPCLTARTDGAHRLEIITVECQHAKLERRFTMAEIVENSNSYREHVASTFETFGRSLPCSCVVKLMRQIFHGEREGDDAPHD